MESSKVRHAMQSLLADFFQFSNNIAKYLSLNGD